MDDPALTALLLRECIAIETRADELERIGDATPIDIGPGRVVEHVDDGVFVDLDYALGHGGLSFIPYHAVYRAGPPSFVVQAWLTDEIRW